MTTAVRLMLGLLLTAVGLALASASTVLLVEPILFPDEPPVAAPGRPSIQAQAPPQADRDRPEADTTAPEPAPRNTPEVASEVASEPAPELPTASKRDARGSDGDRSRAIGEFDRPEGPPAPEPPAVRPASTATEPPPPPVTEPPARQEPEVIAPSPTPEPTIADAPAPPDDEPRDRRRGRPSFPADWPWHAREGNQGRGGGWGPPARARR